MIESLAIGAVLLAYAAGYWRGTVDGNIKRIKLVAMLTDARLVISKMQQVIQHREKA